ncbi:MAG: hypothetical protein KAJ86_07585 [Alphaproteobacteria bacterium]|nr:hypothetical protein [Alphaproteobacteria bacterium]
MPKLLVLNSFGPMGSTLLAGLIEKFGFGNVPFRKTGLHRYLMGELSLDSGFMQNRLKDTLMSHSNPILRGGVSVLDRDNQKPRILVNYDRVMSDIERLENYSFKNIKDLYMTCREVYDRAVIYKTPENHKNWHIELTVDIHRYDPDVLYQHYKKEFEDVRMIHLYRDFRGWINSLASQAFMHPQLMNRIKFFPHMRYADYALYEKVVAKMPGLHINFDDLFDEPIEMLVKKIALFLDVPVPDIDFRKETYDLYGKIQPYDVAFTRFDDNISFLRPATLDYLMHLVDTKSMYHPLSQLSSWSRYIVDLQQYRTKTGYGWL